MVNSHQLDNLRDIWQIVGSKEFTTRDIPSEYKYTVRLLEKQGYLIKTGTAKQFYYDRNKAFVQYRIAARYLDSLKQ